MDIERIKYLQEQCEIIHSYMEPFSNELHQIILDAWFCLHSAEEIAEAFGYKVQTIRNHLSQDDIDWRSRPYDPESVIPTTDKPLKLIY